ncbi:MAG: hypothetical protein WA618_01090, partial [Terriglobales bacterium]
RRVFFMGDMSFGRQSPHPETNSKRRWITAGIYIFLGKPKRGTKVGRDRMGYNYLQVNPDVT